MSNYIYIYIYIYMCVVCGRGLDSAGREQDPVAGSRKHGNETPGNMKDSFLSSWATVSISRRTVLYEFSNSLSAL
jgi:hypothetical protein